MYQGGASRPRGRCGFQSGGRGGFRNANNDNDAPPFPNNNVRPPYNNSNNRPFNNGSSNGFGNVRPNGMGNVRRVYRDNQRDFEFELLQAITSEYQVNCTELRPYDEIFEKIRNNPELFNYVHNSEQSFKEFLNGYREFFIRDEANPAMLRWTKERIYSKKDPKEPRRRERREWGKIFEENLIPYDICLEENVLSLIVYLYDIANDSFIETDLLDKTLRLALQTEVDLLDYLCPNVRAFMVKRNHMFREHMEAFQFFGREYYNVLLALNIFIRSSVGGQNRQTIARVHEYYLNAPDISAEARNNLSMDERLDFVNFLMRGRFVLECTDTHVESKREMPILQTDSRAFRYCAPVLADFRIAIRRQRGSDDEEEDARSRPITLLEPGENGAAPVVRTRRPANQATNNVREPPPIRFEDDGSTIASSVATSRGPTASRSVIENPFMRRQAQQQEQAAAPPESVTAPFQNLSVSGRRGRGVSRQQAEVYLRAPGT